jgi:hypothetical protein
MRTLLALLALASGCATLQAGPRDLTQDETAKYDYCRWFLQTQDTARWDIIAADCARTVARLDAARTGRPDPTAPSLAEALTGALVAGASAHNQAIIDRPTPETTPAPKRIEMRCKPRPFKPGEMDCREE